ncbi:hypothetical protein Smic_27260 [Streptomyces microflavus]|uniref:Uncharacterized protein n=2 Tax=Streptomyces microflavus TaxID=1919 RepID=A0A7J0CNV6_STRMI|nr:hypothetical protein Smic_27260 [Streptomyces microflavus]
MTGSPSDAARPGWARPIIVYNEWSARIGRYAVRREEKPMRDASRLRGAFARLLRPVGLLVLLLAEVLLTEGGSLSAAVALAATAAAGSALLACSVISARCAPPVPRTRVRTAIRDREKRTAFLPQRDPDARGRTRPRAPGHALLTAIA